MNIRDIAAAANVSVSTVSKVLNQKDHDISETTRERVRAVIKEYNYSPYSNIKETSVSRSYLIALVIHPALIKKKFISSLEQQIARSGYSLLLSTLDSETHSLARHLNVLRSKKVEGILFYANDTRYIDSFLQENNSSIPTVFLCTEPLSNQTCIRYDYSAIAFSATKLLLNHGHRKIACILNADTPDEALPTKNGYLQALFDDSVAKDENLILSCTVSALSVHSAFQTLMNQEITAVYCQTGALAASLYTFLHEMNISIPDEISIVCGETSDLTNILYPPITTVELPSDTIGQLATKAVTDAIESPRMLPGKPITIDPVIHKGDSLGLPSVNRTKMVVIGNMNMDIIINTDHLPAPGELIVSNNVFSTPGGKGINQAIGAGKLGGFVYAIGRLGDDPDGHAILETLSNYNIKTDGVFIDTASSTGKAFITVPKGADSAVTSYPGSNTFFDIEQLNKCTPLFTNTDYCLISTELASGVIAHAIKRCQKANVKIFLKPSTTSKIDRPLLGKIDYLVPNENELNQLIMKDGSLEEKVDELYKICPHTIIVTQGESGCYLKNESYSCHFPAAPFTPVDTTGAANCFISALAVSLGEDNDLPYAICFATYAAGLSVTQQGTQSSFPSRAQLEVYQDDINAMYSAFLNATS